MKNESNKKWTPLDIRDKSTWPPEGMKVFLSGACGEWKYVWERNGEEFYSLTTPDNAPLVAVHGWCARKPDQMEQANEGWRPSNAPEQKQDAIQLPDWAAEARAEIAKWGMEQAVRLSESMPSHKIIDLAELLISDRQELERRLEQKAKK